jgi:hypothetical protein
MGESLHIEVGGELVPIPSKGDLLALNLSDAKVPVDLGVCLSVNTTFRHQGERMPLVEMLFLGKILMIPLKSVRIVQVCKSKQGLV